MRKNGASRGKDRGRGRGRGRGKEKDKPENKRREHHHRKQGRPTTDIVTSKSKAHVPSDNILEKVATRLRQNAWKPVFRTLMRHSNQNIEQVIDSIEYRYPRDLNEVKYKCLIKWKECMGEEATLERLRDALNKNSLRSESEYLTEILRKEEEELLEIKIPDEEEYRYRKQRCESGNTSPLSLGFGSEVSMNQEAEDIYAEPENLSEDKLQALLQRVPSDILMFKFNPVDYLRDFKCFMIDIVSMWNTPHRGNAHIVIGVDYRPDNCGSDDLTSNNLCVGIAQKQRRDNDFYHGLFNEHYFNYKPDFVYTEMFTGSDNQAEQKCVGVFTITNNEKGFRTLPCVAGTGLTRQNTSWVSGVVWVRKRGKNMHAKDDYLTTIYNWFEKSNNDVTCTTPVKEGPSDHSEFTSLLDYTDAFSDSSVYCLVTDCLINQEEKEQVAAISFVSWLKVFDFDANSPITGLLNVCEEQIKQSGVLHKTTWKDSPGKLSSGSTNWYFPAGYTIESEYVLEDINSWKEQAGESVDDNCRQLAEYCTARVPLMILVLWYGQTNYKYLIRLILTNLEPYLEGRYKLVICCKGRTVEEVSKLALIVEQIDDAIILSNTSLRTVCEALQQSQNHRKTKKENIIEFELPSVTSDNIPIIKSIDNVWLEICIEVLYLNHNYQPGSGIDKDTQLGFDFLRGDILTWYELQVGKYDADRDIMKGIIAEVVNSVKSCKSGIIEIYHDPGAGGTTLGRRVLWETHLCNKAPCVNVTSFQDTKALSDRIQFLYQKTLLPIVVLIDGSDAIFCRRLWKMLLNCVVVIILVQRTVSKPEPQKNVFHLKGKVTENEAAHIAIAFSKYASSKQRLMLQKLATRVKDNSTHHVYEFGLVVYEEEFKGVQSYVEGYLQYDGIINQWQKVLLFLSLAYYYGHTAIPAQLFAEILGVNKKSAVTLKDNMGYTNFIFEFFEHGIRQWRITHFIVAKEILEQLLGNGDRRISRNVFSDCTKKNIGQLTCDFIEEAAKASLGKRNRYSPAIMQVVLSTVIYRDQNDFYFGRDDAKQQKRPKISRLISDIKSESPYEERLAVIRKITECFPQNPSGWAHLGRLYGLYRPNEISKAREFFEKALTLRKEELKCHSKDRKEEKCTPDTQLTQIYHMYGKVYDSEVRDIIGNMPQYDTLLPKSTSRERDITDPNSEFHKTLERSIESARLAIDNFIMSRRYVKPGYEQTYGYNGELSLRLNIIDFITNHCSLKEYLDCKAADQSCKDFIRECFPKCDILILECHDLVLTQTYEQSDEFVSNVNRFHVLFYGAEEALEIWEGHDTILSRRSKIAAYKLKHNDRRHHHFSIEMVTSSEDVKKIVKLHEDNINQIYNERMSDINFDHDVINWLRMIRSPHCKPKYSIEHVISYVRKWHEVRKSPHALYYLFVLNTLLGIGVRDSKQHHPGLSNNFVEAQKLLLGLQQISSLVSSPKKPLEWIGKLKGIDRLLDHSTLKHKGDGVRFWEKAEVKQLLEIRYGYIVDSSKRVKGDINLILKTAGSTKNSMNVSFVPIHNNLYGKRYKGEKVAFNLAFTMNSGLKAYNVCQVKAINCPECNRSHEYSALEKQKYIHCQCSRGKPIVIKDEPFQM